MSETFRPSILYQWHHASYSFLLGHKNKCFDTFSFLIALGLPCHTVSPLMRPAQYLFTSSLGLVCRTRSWPAYLLCVVCHRCPPPRPPPPPAEPGLEQGRWETAAGCGAEGGWQGLGAHREEGPVSHQAGLGGQVSVSSSQDRHGSLAP